MAGQTKLGTNGRKTDVVERDDAATSELAVEPQERFLGQWHRLVSTTNWEKGRIICQWREALEAAEAPVTAYSDESWSQLVGGVTSQHVGRLRRVFARFGGIFDQYEGLYWSHFQAALDWDDAEMWLEGAIHNRWSVSQMRGKRWETLGKPGDPPAGDDAEVIDDETAADANNDDSDVPFEPPAASATRTSAPAALAEEAAKARNGEQRSAAADAEPASDDGAEPTVGKPKARQRLGVSVEDLPEDVADAFEQFKLAIIAHRRSAWSATTPAAVIECLDALKELALAPIAD